MELSLVQKISIYALPVIFAITLHEAAHGYAARHFGDRTAEMLGRISVNPLRHIDPIGTLLVPTITLFLGGILFGWAKPVPVNIDALKNPRRDMLWVAAAGPGANLVMALFWALTIKLAHGMDPFFGQPLMLMGMAGITINAILAALNLLPLPPLDGGRIAVSLLPHPLASGLARLEPYGLVILIVLLFTGLLAPLIGPMYQAVQRLSLFIVGL